LNDRRHITFALYYGADFLISMNFDDIVKKKTKDGVKKIATVKGYGNVEIVTPKQFLEIIKGGEYAY
jgi:predicted nucleic acid-binding protein